MSPLNFCLWLTDCCGLSSQFFKCNNLPMMHMMIHWQQADLLIFKHFTITMNHCCAWMPGKCNMPPSSNFVGVHQLLPRTHDPGFCCCGSLANHLHSVSRPLLALPGHWAWLPHSAVWAGWVNSSTQATCFNLNWH